MNKANKMNTTCMAMYDLQCRRTSTFQKPISRHWDPRLDHREEKHEESNSSHLKKKMSKIKSQPTPCSILLGLVFSLKEKKMAIVVEGLQIDKW